MPTKTPRQQDLDELDMNIISALSVEADVSHKELARKFNVSPGTIHFRIIRLKDAGVLGNTRVKVNLQRVGLKMTAFVGIYLQNASRHDFVVGRLMGMKEVIRVHTITGPYSLLAELVCSDTEHLRSVLHGKIQHISGIDRTESMISLQEEFSKDVAVPSVKG